MVKLTKEDENKLGQILKELNEMRNVLKGGEGSGVRGHKSFLRRHERESDYPELMSRKKRNAYQRAQAISDKYH